MVAAVADDAQRSRDRKCGEVLSVARAFENAMASRDAFSELGPLLSDS